MNAQELSIHLLWFYALGCMLFWSYAMIVFAEDSRRERFFSPLPLPVAFMVIGVVAMFIAWLWPIAVVLKIQLARKSILMMQYIAMHNPHVHRG